MEIDIILSNLHENQEKVLQEKKRFNVLCCGRRWGKSELALELLIKPALDGYPVGYFAPTYKLLDGVYNECISILDPIITRRNDCQFIELNTKGRIDFWSLENELAGRSRKYKVSVLDECAFAKNLWKLWTESIRATLTDYKGDAWFLSTPRGKNDFYKLHQRHQSGEDKWMSWQMSTYTNPYIDPSEVDDAKRDLPELAFSQEYLAQFNESVANPFGINFIQQCTYPMSTLPPVCFGIDLAKSYDWTVIIGLDVNGSVCHFDRFQKDWKQTITHINNLPVVPISIDTTGVGDPVAEMVDKRYYLDMFKFSNTSKQQLMEMLAIGIQQRKINFPEGLITEELGNFEYEYTKGGVKYSAPTGLHDDCVCSLALAWRMFKSGAANGVYNLIM